MELLNLLKQVPLPIMILVIAVLLVLTIVIAFQYAKMKGLEGIREDAYKLILEAEHKFTGDDKNKQKLAYVIQQARGLLPKWLQIIFTEERMKNIINEWYKGVKDLLDDGKVNGSQK